MKRKELFIFLLLIGFAFFIQNTSSASGNYITVSGNDFYLNGNVWRPFGVNYFPSYSDYSHPYDVTYHWLHESKYNSSIIQSELSRIKDMGFNAVAIQTPNTDPPSCSTINSFLDIAENNSLKVLLFIHNCDPVGLHRESVQYGGDYTQLPNYDKCVKTINNCNLKDNPTIFAYDIAWEPGMYDYQTVSQYFNYFWHQWLIERYDSISNAESNLNYSFNFDSNGYAMPPSESELCSNSNVPVVSAFRRFFDDWESKELHKVVTKIKNEDSNHLVSSRTGLAFMYEPYCNFMPVDIRATAKAFDFMGAENYGTGNVRKEAGFNIEYSSMLDTKPVVFIEFGYNGDENSQKTYFQNIYDAVQEFGAQGSFAWWYIDTPTSAGNFGIINYTDSSEKKVVQVIRNYSDILKSPVPSKNPPFDWVVFDADSVADKQYNQNLTAGYFQNSLNNGNTPFVMTYCSGTDSLTPYIPSFINSKRCVGNTNFDWHCPLKCLNSEFNFLQIKNSSGGWQEVIDNSIVYIPKNNPVYIKASIGNIGEGKWILYDSSGNLTGTVALGDPYSQDYLRIRLSDNNISFLNDWNIPETTLISNLNKSKNLTLSLLSEGIAWFGEKIQNITLNPINTAPYFNMSLSYSALINTSIEININVYDINNDPITLTKDSNFGQINSTTNIFSWTPLDTGEYNVTFTASDGELSANETIFISIFNNSEEIPQDNSTIIISQNSSQNENLSKNNSINDETYKNNLSEKNLGTKIKEGIKKIKKRTNAHNGDLNYILANTIWNLIIIGLIVLILSVSLLIIYLIKFKKIHPNIARSNFRKKPFIGFKRAFRRHF